MGRYRAEADPGSKDDLWPKEECSHPGDRSEQSTALRAHQQQGPDRSEVQPG